MKQMSKRLASVLLVAGVAVSYPLVASAQAKYANHNEADNKHPEVVEATRDAGHKAQRARKLNRIDPAVRPSDGFAIVRPNDLGDIGFAASIIGNYAYLPQSYRINKERYAVVEHQIMGHLGISFGMWKRLSIDINAPFQLYLIAPDAQNAPDQILAYAKSGDFNMGDAQVGLRARIWGENEDPFSIGLYGGVVLPTASWINPDQKYFGNPSKISKNGIADDSTNGSPNIRGQVKILLEGRPTDRLNIDLNIGGVFGMPQAVNFAGGNFKEEINFDQELSWALGVSYYFLEKKNLSLHAEGFGTFMSFDQIAQPKTTHIELLGGVKYMTDFGLGVGLAGGAGIGSGFGTPVARALFTLGWQSAGEPDTDGDGIPDSRDQCPDIPEDLDGFEDEDGCPDPDNDNDGILDINDMCPNEAEDFDGFQDEDGCPDLDNDGDGIPDTEDKCPNVPGLPENDGCPLNDQDKDGIPDDVDKCPTQPEDFDGFQDEDGCPDSDNDGDGILDEEDKCPNEPGPRSNNGCPVQDRDNDGIPDHLDKCPDEPETYNGIDDEDGCPDGKASVEVTEKSIKINETIYFATGKATIKRQSFQLLDTVASVLNRYDQITKVRIEGHTDDVGRDAANLKLSKARAASVRDYLINKGVEASRLESEGYGEEQPLCKDMPELTRTRKLARKNRKEIKECRAVNRRVDFTVVEVNNKPVDGTAVIKVESGK